VLKSNIRIKEKETRNMVSGKVKVVNEQGLHMRPAGVFAKEMTKFNSNITLDVAGKKVNAKSVMLIIAACIKCGTEVTIECDGADEKEALAKAVELIESGFGE
jgi:phosphocarrier protein